MPCKSFMSKSMVNMKRFIFIFSSNKMTPENCRKELLEVLEDEVYVIGGIVDRSVGSLGGFGIGVGGCVLVSRFVNYLAKNLIFSLLENTTIGKICVSVLQIGGSESD